MNGSSGFCDMSVSYQNGNGLKTRRNAVTGTQLELYASQMYSWKMICYASKCCHIYTNMNEITRYSQDYYLYSKVSGIALH